MNTQIQKPKFLLTYWCLECGAQTLLSELDEPYCDACQRNRKLLILSKEKFSREVIDEKIKIVNAYLIIELEKTLATGTKNQEYDRKSTMIKLMKAKKLKKLMESRNLSNEELGDFFE